MSPLESAITTLNRLAAPATTDAAVRVDGRASLLVTLVYLVAVLSLPLTAPVRILWLTLYPIVAATLTGIGYGRLLRRSLIIIPLVAVFAAFNPVFDRVPVAVGHLTVARGWLSFASVIVRGVLAFQALLLLVETEGFTGMCDALRRLRVPAVFTVQLLMVYRYLTVLLAEALTMWRARQARGYGRRHMPIAEWGPFVGQLFVRTVARSERIHNAMLARGFDGTMPQFSRTERRWTPASTIWLAAWCAAILLLRYVDLTRLFQ